MSKNGRFGREKKGKSQLSIPQLVSRRGGQPRYYNTLTLLHFKSMRCSIHPQSNPFVVATTQRYSFCLSDFTDSASASLSLRDRLDVDPARYRDGASEMVGRRFGGVLVVGYCGRAGGRLERRDLLGGGVGVADEEEEEIKLGRIGEETVGELVLVDEGKDDWREGERTSRGRWEVTEDNGG